MDGNFSVDRGFDAYGNHTEVIVEGDDLIRKTTYDAEPLLREAHAARTATAGDRWQEGTGTRVGTIPMAVYAQFLTIPDAEERQKFILRWLRENPAFVTFDKFLK